MTKLHKTATALLLAAALLLSGCAEQRNSPTQEMDNTFLDSVFSNSTDNADGNNASTVLDGSASYEDPGNSSDWGIESYFKRDVENYPLDYITLPDGSMVSKYEAIGSGGNGSLKFDFTFIRYAKPVFHTTIDEPDLIEWESVESAKTIHDFKWKVDTLYAIEDPEYFKVKPGDRLKNGLVVKSAEYLVGIYGVGRVLDVSFDGEITLTGVLSYYLGDEGEGAVFFADSTSQFIPILLPGIDGDVMQAYIAEKQRFAMVFDDTFFSLGNINDIDLSGTISPGEYKKVRVTLKNITSHYVEGPNRSSCAELVSVEPIT